MKFNFKKQLIATSLMCSLLTLSPISQASSTYVTGINTNGVMVGYFNDAKGTHGFGYNSTLHDPFFTVDNPNAVTTILPTVPVPAAIYLFGSALLGLVGFNRRKSAHRII